MTQVQPHLTQKTLFMNITSSPLKPRQIGTPWKTLAVAALAAAWNVQTSSAVLTFDLRAANAASGSKSATVAPGDSVVLLDLWMVVTGTDAIATNDGLLSINGIMVLSGSSAPSLGGISLDNAVPGNNAILGVPNTLHGALAPFNTGQGNTKVGLIAPWDSSGTSAGGIARDLNGDGFTDIGGTTSNSAGNGFIAANASVVQNSASGLTPVTNFNLLANGVEFRLARYTFTITGGLSGSTGVNVAVPLFSAAINASRASWTRDGTVGQNGVAANLAVGSPVLISVPEPSAFGMVLVGIVGLLGFRRLGLRNA